jgi:hypothetical protein
LSNSTGTDAAPGLPASIPESHARALSAHFKTVEEYLRVVESSLEGFEGVFLASSSEMPAAQQARIRSLSEKVLDGLREIKRDLRLQAIESSSIGVVRAYLSELWVSLAETRGRHLSGYGAVPADLAAYLDDRVGKLESLVEEIRTTVESVARGGTAKPGAPATSDRAPR